MNLWFQYSDSWVCYLTLVWEKKYTEPYFVVSKSSFFTPLFLAVNDVEASLRPTWFSSFLKQILFTYLLGCIRSLLCPVGSFLAAHGLSSCDTGSGAHGLSSCSSWTLERGLSSCAQGLGCSSAHGILVPWSGIEPESPALQGGFLTTEPPGKS